MSRPLRIEFAGAWYHVMNRGAGRKRVFKTDEQRAFFLSVLAETFKRFNAEWHAYCLMDNHYHLLVRTPDANLQRIMRHVNGLYTQYFNRQEKRSGPLFRGRYNSIVVEADAYWLELSRYIHRNPVDEGAVKDLAAYQWSSYRSYVGLDATPPWLTTKYILNAIGVRDSKRRYVAYVAGDTDEALLDFYAQAKINPILGSDPFRKKVLSGKVSDISRPELRSASARPALKDVVAAVCREFGVDQSTIWVSTRGRGVTSPARSITMVLCQQVADMRLSQIADTFSLASYASAGATIRTTRARIEEDKVLANSVKAITRELLN